MKKNVLIFGVILGTILITNGLIMVNLICNNPEFRSNDLLGYAFMIVVFSLIFFGVRNYRNKELGGTITFGRALKTGVLIALVASTVYVVVWLFYYYLFAPDFLDQFTRHVLHQATLDGASESELAAKKEGMQNFAEMYENPFMVVLITYSEVLPVGLAVALVSAMVLFKNKKQ